MGLFDRLQRLLSGSGQIEKVQETAPASAMPIPLRVRAGKLSATGYYRENNEDRVASDTEHGIHVVADGMGGQAAGEQASQMAVEMIPARLQQIPAEDEARSSVRQWVREAVLETNLAILAKGEADPGLRHMGTTVVLAFVRGQFVYIASIGDSRAYRLRNGQLELLTTDHSLAQALLDMGTISKEEMKNHRFKNRLYKYLGSKEAEQGPDITELDLRDGDRFLLVSDGVTGVLEDAVLAEELAKSADPQGCAEHLVNLALEAGSRDNSSCVVLFVEAAG